MDFSSFENLNTLYQFKAVDKCRNPIPRHPLKRISFSTTALINSRGKGEPFRSSAASACNMGFNLSATNNSSSTDHKGGRSPRTSTGNGPLSPEFVRQFSDESDGPATFIVGDDKPAPDKFTSRTKYRPAAAPSYSGLKGSLLIRQQPLLNRSQTVECLGDSLGAGKILNLKAGKINGKGTAGLVDRNYYEWYDPMDKSGTGLKFGDKFGGMMRKGGPLGTSYILIDMGNGGIEDLDLYKDSHSNRGSESYQSLLIGKRERKLTTSVEKLLALK